MIRVSIVLVPHGIEDAASVLATLRIVNVAPSGCGEGLGVSDYRVEIDEGRWSRRYAEVKGFERARGALALVGDALAALLTGDADGG